MNVPSARFAQFSLKAASRPRAALLAVLALAPLLGAVSPASQAQSQAAGGDQPIVASLNPPPAGLDCTSAAAATSVYFQFANPPFQISQISIYLDGKGVAQDAVDEHWPTVTLSKGLHPGSNTVDIVANGASGQHIERRMLVQVGGASNGATGTAQVACDDAAVAQQQAPLATDPGAGSWDDQTQYGAVGDPPPVVVQDSPPVVYDDPPQVVYDYPPPVYVYSPYPVVAFGPWVPFVPFFGFGFFYSHYHPYFGSPRFVNGGYYGHGGWNGGGWHGGPGPGSGGWHGGNPGNYAGPRPNNGGGPAWRGQAPAAQQSRGGWQGAPRPAQASGGQYRGGYSAPAQQFRPAPQQYRPQQQYHPQQQYRPQQQNFRAAAPAFHGGGGGGGRGAPASHGGGGRHR